MMVAHKFDVRNLEKLNDPGRLVQLDPEAMWRALGEPSPATIVEIGAGTGLFAREFARRAPGALVYACDTEDVMLDWMRDRLPEVASGRIVPVRSEESTVPLSDGLADLVYMVNLHHELRAPAAIYAEARRLLVPGGKVLVVDWADRETPKGPPLIVRASADELAGFLGDAGFRDIAVHEGLPWHSLLTAEA